MAWWNKWGNGVKIACLALKKILAMEATSLDKTLSSTAKILFAPYLHLPTLCFQISCHHWLFTKLRRLIIACEQNEHFPFPFIYKFKKTLWLACKKHDFSNHVSCFEGFKYILCVIRNTSMSTWNQTTNGHQMYSPNFRKYLLKCFSLNAFNIYEFGWQTSFFEVGPQGTCVGGSKVIP